jgi:hypothetical protein
MHLNLLEIYSADIEVVFEMFLNENYHRRKIVEGRGGRNFQILDYHACEKSVRIKMEYEADVDLPESFPAKYKKYVKKANVFTNTVEWLLESKEEIRQGVMTIQVHGMPLEVNGKYLLRPCDGGCERQVSVDIDYKLPVVGKIISKVFASSIKKTLEAEYEFNKKMLAER